MARYLIRLKPIDEFFFGTEKGFKDEENNWQRSNENTTYLIKSRKFPQQTTLLGMLRMEILVQDEDFTLKELSEYKDEDWDEMRERIGPNSFDLEKIKQDFGLLKKISPLFMYQPKEESYYLEVPKDHKKDNNMYTPFKLGECKVRTNLGELTLFQEKEYDAKQGLASGWLNLETKELFKSGKENRNIFIESKQVGINKEQEKDAFYKQVFYRLRDSFEFAFFIESDFEFEDSIIQLGKESSTFKLIVEQTEESFTEITTSLKEDIEEENKLILASDTYLSQSIYKKIDFAICNGVSFRNLKTNNGKLEKNKAKYNFWERGSVIYPQKDMKEEVKTEIKKNKNLVQIGYNQYI